MDNIKTCTVIGMGPGPVELLAPIAVTKILAAEFIAGAPRLLNAAAECIRFAGKTPELLQLESNWSEAVSIIDAKRKEKTTAVLVSGDPMLYSFTAMLARRIPAEEMDIIPGISSGQLLAVKTGTSLNDSAVVSFHGKKETDDIENRFRMLSELGKLVSTIVVYTDGTNTPGTIARRFSAETDGTWEAVIGRNLGMENERTVILSLEGAAEYLINKEDLCVMILKRKD